MLMDISLALKNPGQSYPFETTLEVEPMIVLDDPVRFDSVCLKGTYTGAGDSVRIEAALSADVESRCALCLEPVQTHVEADVDVSFVKDLSEDDFDSYPLTGYRIDIQPMVEEALVLELPMRFLCSDDCKGICPVCGTNRNIAPCTCQEGGERRNPFSAMSELLTEDVEV